MSRPEAAATVAAAQIARAAMVAAVSNTYYVVGSMLSAHCMECGEPLGTMFGTVQCSQCATKYIIKRVRSTDAAVFYSGEADTKTVQVLKQPARTYFPPVNAYRMIMDAAAPDHIVDPTATVQLNPTICTLCHKPLEAIQSVRVVSSRFIDDEVLESRNGIQYMKVYSKPAFRIGRVHPACLNDAQYAGKVTPVEHRIIPSKHQHTRTERGDYKLERFKPVDHGEIEIID